jgi:heme/copper-type cytochrome/quinol oxidase subunit 4
METLKPLMRTSTTVAWIVLIGLTLVSWWLGTEHGFGAGDDHEAATIVVFVVSFFKVRLVGLYFMELNEAPIWLRAMLEVYVVVVCAACIGMYLLA